MSYKELRKKISSVLVVALLFGMLAPAMALGAEAVKLKDIADSYAKTEIQALVDAGIVSGYEDGSFQPTKAMTRAELAKIIVLALGKKENADKAASFADVSKDSWYRGYVGALVESGITDGTSATTFSPDANVTREELVVFFVRAMGLEETAKKVAADAKLSDLAQVSSWAKAHVSLAFKMGFVQGIENSNGTLSFNPKANAERQALARLAYEFKTNKTKFVDKAQAIAKAEEKPSTGGSTGTSGGGGGVSYGGGGGSNSGNGGSYNYSTVELINMGGQTISSPVTLGSGVYGPADGKTTKITGTLTLNPGENGSVTLKNIEADNIVVASGASESIHLNNVKVKVNLKVDAPNQAVAVRIVAEGNTSITETEITSQVIIKNSTSSGAAFGGITVNPSVAGQKITVEGTISTTITVNGKITLNAAEGSSISSIQLNSKNANVSLSGSGTIQTIIAAVTGAVLNILDNSVNLQKIQFKSGVKLTLEGETTKNKIKDVQIEAPAGSDLSDLIDSVIDGILDAVKIAIAKNDLNITYANGESAGSVTSNLKLPLTGSNGAAVVWSSDKPSVISNSGEVFSQLNDTEVTLTATITLGSLTTTKVFVVTVKAAKTAVKGIKGFDASYVEVYFLEPVGSVNKEDFTFDNDLVVNSAAVKQGTTDVVALQTSAQTPGKAYTLSYKGVNTGKSFAGYVPPAATTGSVTGYVYGTGDAAVSGATVTVTGTSNSTTTGSDGQFSLSNIDAGDITLKVSASNYLSVTSATYTVVAGTTTPVGPIALVAVPSIPLTGSVTGYVYGTNDAAVSGATVTVTGTTYSTSTDINGKFTLSDLVIGNITLSVAASNYMSVTSATYTVLPAITTTVGPISLTATNIPSTVTLNVYNVFKSSNAAVTTDVYGPLSKNGANFLISNAVNFGATDYLVIQFSDTAASDVLTGSITVNGGLVLLNGASVEAAVYETTVGAATYLVVKPGAALISGTQTLTVTGFTYTDGLSVTKIVNLELPVEKQQ